MTSSVHTSTSSSTSAGSMVFVGGGQMACALIGGLLDSGWPAATISVIDPNEDQRARLSQRFGVDTSASAGAALEGAEVVIWAVKPQMLRDAVGGAQAYLPEALHISIAAGVGSADLSRWLGSERVVRVMPNTSALVGAGVTGMFARAGVSAEDRGLASRIMAATGFCFWVESDERLDAVTAVSGSGPAYVFKFLEGFQAAAESVGFSASEARHLVLLTAAGAIEQARREATEFSSLRERVTSKRGTTEAALDVLDKSRVAKAMTLAVQAAFKRSAELSIELGQART